MVAVLGLLSVVFPRSPAISRNHSSEARRLILGG